MLKSLELLLQLLIISLIKRPVNDETGAIASVDARRYRRKKEVVKSLWLASGVMMMLFPITHFIITLGLFTTFLSFTILDESV